MKKALALLLVAVLPSVALARGGDLDPMLGASGAQPILSATNDTAFVFGRQADGKVVSARFDVNNVQVQRRNRDGTLDATFGAAGSGGFIYPRAVPAGSGNFVVPIAPKAILFDGEGRILLAGEANIRCGTLGLVRLQPNGTVDASFGSNGVSAPVTGDPQPTNCTDGTSFSIGALRFLPDGRIGVATFAGEPLAASPRGTAVAGRFLASGAPDTTFGDGGFVRSVYDWVDHPGGATVRDDGSVEFVHSRAPVAGGSWTLVSTRLAADGRNRTESTLPVPVELRQTPGVVFQSDRSRLIYTRTDGVGGAVTVVRVDAADKLDAAYGGSGSASLAFEPAVSVVAAMQVQDGGALFVASAPRAPNDALAMAKLDSRGLPEPNFGSGGRLSFSASPQSEFPWQVSLGRDGYVDLFLYTVTRVGADRRYTWFFTRAQAVGDVVEFENTVLDHYFLAYDGAEARGIDAGAAGPGWHRTGMSFRPAGDRLVCRFYGTPGIGPNSHFFTADEDECALVKLDPGWTFEGEAFAVRLRATGFGCPTGTYPVYRAYNQRAAQNDSNHRYIVDGNLLNAMVARGWASEGVAFCAYR